MEKIVAIWLGLAVSEQTSFLIKSGIFLSVCGATLFVALAASYPRSMTRCTMFATR